MPVIALLCIIGTYSINNSLLDTWIMVVFGVVGFLMRRFDFEAPPLVLGMVFGEIIETNLIKALLTFQGNIFEIILRPIAGFTFGLTFLGLIIMGLIKHRHHLKSEV